VAWREISVAVATLRIGDRCATRWSVDQVLALAPEVSSERAAGGRAAVLLPRLPVIELLAATLRFRHGLLEELG